MKRLLILFFACSILAACHSSQSLSLSHAYNNQDVKELEQFMTQWSKESTTTKPKDDTEKAIYQLFQAFYRPNQMSIYNRDGAFFADDERPLIVVNGILHYAVCNKKNSLLQDSIANHEGASLAQLNQQKKDLDLKTIQPFHPRFETNQSKVLYLDSIHRKTLEDFLGPYPEDDSSKIKSKWLKENASLSIPYNEWASSYYPEKWLVETAPQIAYIFLDENLEKASIYFILGDLEAGLSYFKKEAGTWKRTKHFIRCIDCD